MSFIHLHNHSEYSALDGMSQVAQMPKIAKKLGQTGIALTDHGVMSGALDFYKACEKEGVQPIVGMEGYITPFGVPRASKDKTNSHLLLLAMNQIGYKNLMKLSTAAHLEGFYFRPRMDWDILEQFNEGLITTTGCLGAELYGEWIKNGRFDKADEAFQRFLRIFGDRFYAELQDHGGEEFQVYNAWLAETANRYGVPMIATNDSHYISEDDVKPHDMMLCVQTGKKVDDADRMRMEGGSYYIKTTEAMNALFGQYPGAISNTVDLAKRCKLDLNNKGFHLPTFEIPSKFSDEDEYLKELCLTGLDERYTFKDGVAVVNSPLLPTDFEKDKITKDQLLKQLDYELSVVAKMKFSRYFLIVWDIIEFSKRNGIWFNVRGSAAGAIISYVLGLTDIEPVSNGLYFERFLNPDRVSMPDIDMDFEHERRHEVIQYTIDKYGSDKVAQIATFGTMKAKMALKDMCRVLNVSISDSNKLAAFVPDTPNMPVGLNDIKDNPALQDFLGTNPLLQKAFDAASKLEGTIRSVGTHAAGVVISDKPLTEYVPLMKVKGEESAMTQYEMGNLEAQGLLKMDYLGLTTLTLFRKVCERINAKYNLNLNMDNIPIHAPEIYQLLRSGRTLGVFQMESQGMTQVLTQMKPDRYENIIAAVALFRPGPLEYIPLYIKRMHGEVDIEYRHKDLEPILGETMGVCVSENTEVITASGRKLIKELIVGDSVLSYNESSGFSEFKKVKSVVNNGVKKTILIKSKNGDVICTPDHKFFTLNGWERADNLNKRLVATYSEIKNIQSCFGNNKARLLGLLISEGRIKNGNCIFYNKDLSLLNSFKSIIYTEFTDCSITSRKNYRGVTTLTVKHNSRNTFPNSPSSVVTWLRNIGCYGESAKDKTVSNIVYKISKNEKMYLLSGLFDGDGSCLDNNTWHYTSISPRLIKDVEFLLKSIGIHCRVNGIRVEIIDREKFSMLVLPLMAKTNKANFQSSYSVKIDNYFALNILNQIGYTPAKKSKAMYGIDYQMAARVIKNVGNHCKLNVTNGKFKELALKQLPKNFTTFESVTSITDSNDTVVYDIEVEDNHNFYANGILVHNCIYQEQIMAIASGIAGYTKAESDTIRKAVGKKDKEALLKHEQKFISGAISKGYSKELGEQIWKDIEYFARYGFNKAHAAVYAKIACQTAWLKANYPIEFMAEYFNVEYDDADKVKAAIQECKAVDIGILPPSVNLGYADFEIEYPNNIRFGMKAIKGIGLDVISKITNNRSKPYPTLREFAERSGLPVRIIEPLIKAGACDDFGLRAQLLTEAEDIVKSAKSKAKAVKSGQVLIEGIFEDEPTEVKSVRQEINLALLDGEMEVLGFYFNEHPEQKAVSEFGAPDKAKKLNEMRKGQSCIVAGIIRKVKEITTKTQKQMAFVLIEDETGSIDVTIFPKTWDDYKDLLTEGNAIQVVGRYDDAGRNPKIIGERISNKPNAALSKAIIEKPKEIFYLFLDSTPGLIELAINLAQEFQGDIPLSVVCDNRIIDFQTKVGNVTEFVATLQQII